MKSLYIKLVFKNVLPNTFALVSVGWKKMRKNHWCWSWWWKASISYGLCNCSCTHRGTLGKEPECMSLPWDQKQITPMSEEMVWSQWLWFGFNDFFLHSTVCVWFEFFNFYLTTYTGTFLRLKKKTLTCTSPYTQMYNSSLKIDPLFCYWELFSYQKIKNNIPTSQSCYHPILCILAQCANF